MINDDMLHVTSWEWGEKEWSPFSAKEMARRQGDLRAYMATEQVDADVIPQHLLLLGLALLLLRAPLRNGH